MAVKIDLTSCRLGKLLVIKQDDNSRGDLWVCICDCGLSRSIPRSDLLHRTHPTRACKRCAAIRHGGVGTKEYRTWVAMKIRCNDQSYDSYKDYGAKGVSICERWSDFSLFLSDMGLAPSVKHTILDG